MTLADARFESLHNPDPGFGEAFPTHENGQRDQERNSATSTRRRTAVALESPSGVVVRQLFVAYEIAVVVLCGVAAKFAYIDLYLAPEPLSKYLAPLMAAAFLTFAIFRQRGLFAPAAVQNVPGAAGNIIGSMALVFLVIIALGFLFRNGGDYSRIWLFIWFALTLTAIFFSRVIVQSLVGFAARTGAFRTKVAVYGEGESLDRALSEFASERPDIEIAGVFGPQLELLQKQKTAAPAILAGGVAELVKFARERQIDQILIVPSLIIRKQLSGILPELGSLPCDIEFLAHEVDSVIPVDVSLRGNHVFLGLQRRPIAGWNAILKGAEDKIFGSLALFLAAPVMLLIAAAIKLDSPGPVFFRQRRHGFNHKVFSVWKFRTMSVMEDGPAIVQARANDPRVTRAGSFLRKTSLDELPQLINVVFGDMSLVGPRPHALAHNDDYSNIVSKYASRHVVRPGITGWAQIHGYRGPTADPELMRKRIEHDLYYIQHWSLWLDLKILALTPFLGFVNRNAL